MKGYVVPYGYMGYIPDFHGYVLFASEQDYKETFAAWEKVRGRA